MIDTKKYVLNTYKISKPICIQLGRLLLTSCFVLGLYNPISAQNYDNQSEFETEYMEQAYKPYSDNRYKRSAREEDRYNNWNRIRNESDKPQVNPGGIGITDFLLGRKKSGSGDADDLGEDGKDNSFDRYKGIGNGVERSPDDPSLGFSNQENFEPGKGQQNPKEWDEKVPPPPDTPDVSVNSVWGKMLLFVAFFFTVLIKRRFYEK